MSWTIEDWTTFFLLLTLALHAAAFVVAIVRLTRYVRFILRLRREGMADGAEG
jgi:hypothetical protein